MNRSAVEEPGELRARLEHVRWIGGGSGGGKSTVARMLAADHRLRLYASDAIGGPEFVARCTPSSTPLLQAFVAMDMDERWLNRSPHVMLESFHWFQGEAFELILADLLALPDDTPILAEGFKFLPRLVSPLLTRRSQAVWLVPTPEFRRRAFDSRGSTWDIAGKTSDPERALANLLARDQLFTDFLVNEAEELELQTVRVDGTLTTEDLARRVAADLGLSAP